MANTSKTYFQPAFVICVAVLFITAAGMSFTVKKFGMVLQKDPLPLRQSLEFLDRNGVGPYTVVVKQKIENQDVLRQLGTEDYIQWVLEDTEASAASTVKQCVLFITYYSLPDRVPHVPEECYTGGGFQRLSSERVPVVLNSREIAVKYLVFASSGSGPWMSNIKFPIFYLFSVNGQYTNSREDTRLVLNKNIFGKYSYFSKVEWKFFGNKLGDNIYPSKEDAIIASQKLLKTVLPILEKEHWPQILSGDVSDVNTDKHEKGKV